MATHISAWSASVDQATLARIAALTDDVLTPDGTDRYLVPAGYNNLRWAFATGVNLSRGRIVSPSLDTRRMNLELNPRRNGAATLTLASPEIWIPPRPIALIPTESIEAQTAEDGAGATRMYLVAALGLAELPPMPEGDIRQVRATGTTTLTANAWTTVTLTLETSLEPGTYALVGFIAVSANAIAARVLPQGGGFRPGLPAFAGTEVTGMDFEAALIRSLMFHTMMTFTHVTIPQFQYLASAADTAETVYLYIIRTGP